MKANRHPGVQVRAFLYLCVAIVFGVPVYGHADPWRFAVLGDTRSSGGGSHINTDVVAEIVSSVVTERVDLVLVTGDLVNSGRLSAFDEWIRAFDPLRKAGVKVLPMRGNHDLTANPQDWDQAFNDLVPMNGPTGEVFKTYFVTNRNACFLVLDNYSSPSKINVEWVNSVLASNTLPHVFAAGHEPAFKVGHPDCLADNPDVRNRFWRLMVRFRAKAYFCGHDHFYSAIRLDDGDGNSDNDVLQLIVGSGGAPLYSGDAFDGDNGSWKPMNLWFATEYGYVLAEIDGASAGWTWKQRTSQGIFEAKHKALLPNGKMR